MSNFALAIPAPDGQNSNLEGSFLKSGLRRLLDAVKGYNYESRTGRIALYNNVTAFLVMLPYSLSELPRLKPEKVRDSIKEACLASNIKGCLMPPELQKFSNFEMGININIISRFVYKSLLLETLKEIYSAAGIKIENLDITIIQGRHVGELTSFVRALSSEVKYITVLVSDRKAVEGEAEKIFIDSGLSVGLSADSRSSLKNAQLIINLGDGNEAVLSRANPKALIFNFGNLNPNGVLCDNVVVNGIEVLPPGNIAAKFPDEAYRLYGLPVLGSLVLFNRVDAWDRNSAGLYDYLHMKKIHDAYRRDSFSIGSLIGRRGALKGIDAKFFEKFM